MLKRSLPWVLLVALVAFVGWKLHTSHFDWAGFLTSLRTADFKLIALATVLIYANYLLRAMRWAVFLKPVYRGSGLKRTSWVGLVGSQFIGFTGLAIFGRIGELIRPLLVARRTGLTFSSQVAVMTIERVFDLGAFALLFSLNLLLSPGLQTLPYHEKFHTVGFAVAGLTLFLVVFVAGVRLAGGLVAGLVKSLVGLVSKPAGGVAADKILEFRDGLNVIDSFGDFLLVTGLSIALWATIALSYVAVMKAFPAPVHGMTLADTVVLLGFSVVGSLVSLPGVGGGAQVGIISALTLLFSMPKELAFSAGLMAWLITTMTVIPAGLVFARLEGISLGQMARGSERAEQDAPLVDTV